jgi:hypothetical protein
MAQAWNVFIIPAVGAAAGILIAAAEVFYYNKVFAGQWRQQMPCSPCSS